MRRVHFFMNRGERLSNYMYAVLVFLLFVGINYAKQMEKAASCDSVQIVPSIMFVIDYSGSMVGPTGNDPENARIRVPAALIDTLFRKNPAAEVGLSLWAGELKFDHDDDPYNEICPGEEGGYCPLYQLNKVYTATDTTGYDILNWYLDVTGDLLTYFTSGYQITGTNITTGIKASKHAFSNAQYEKKYHFNIFFSDDEPNLPEPDPFSFVEGSDVATTFTIFFGAATSPQYQVDFTSNIQNNGYSQTNPNSILHTIESVTVDTLLSYLIGLFRQHNIIGDSNVKIKPRNTGNQQSVFFRVSNSKVQIKLPCIQDQGITAHVFDIHGREVIDLGRTGNNNTIVWRYTNAYGIPVSRGIYLVRIERPDGIYSKKVIVNR